MWREKVTNASNHIFPGLDKYEIALDDNYIKIGHKAVSNLGLQVSLYFNLIYFPFWLLVNLVMILDKFSNLSNLYQFIMVVAFGAILVIECIRIYLGYKGNLKEKVPELAAFWIMTVLLQAPLQIFILVSSGLKPSILERIIQIIMSIFLCSQIILGFIALRNSAKHSIHSFTLSNFTFPDMDNEKDL